MKSVLIIEDNYEIRDNIQELLSLAGFNILTAGDGQTGIKMAFESRPDLVLCDILMPNIDGYGVLKAMKNNIATAKIPFIYVSASAEKSDIALGIALGAQAYIVKPFDAEALILAINNSIKNKS